MCSGTYCVGIVSFLEKIWTVMRREWITRRTAEASARLPPFQASRSSPFWAPPTTESGQVERTVSKRSRGSGRCPCHRRTTAAPERTQATVTALSPVYQSPATRTSLWTSPASVSDATASISLHFYYETVVTTLVNKVISDVVMFSQKNNFYKTSNFR